MTLEDGLAGAIFWGLELVFAFVRVKGEGGRSRIMRIPYPHTSVETSCCYSLAVERYRVDLAEMTLKGA